MIDVQGDVERAGWRAPALSVRPCCRGVTMVRATFFAVGLFITLWGVGLLFVDKMVLNMKGEAVKQSGFRGLFAAVAPEQKKVLDPPDWAAFSLMSVGTVTMLYSVALPKKPG